MDKNIITLRDNTVFGVIVADIAGHEANGCVRSLVGNHCRNRIRAGVVSDDDSDLIIAALVANYCGAA